MWQACILSDKILQNAQRFSFERAKIHVHDLFQGGSSFVDLSCFSVLCLLCLCTRLFMFAGEKADLLVSWVRCGT